MSDVPSDNDELPEDVRALLEGERDDLPAPSAAREMVLDRVFSTVGLAPAPHPAQPTQPPPPVVPATAGSATAATAASAGWTGALVVGAVIVVVVAGSFAARSRAPASVPVRSSVPVISSPIATSSTVAPVVHAAPSPALAPRAPQATPEPASRPTANAHANAGRPSATIDESPDALEEEQRLLGAAQRSLTQRDSAGALATIRAHARRFPRGTLAEERDALEIRALLLAQREDEARALAARFRRRYPDSVFIATIDARLGDPR